MATTTSTTPYALSLTVTGTSGSAHPRRGRRRCSSIWRPPQVLTATPGNAQVSLSWPRKTIGATSYHVKRAQVSGGPYTTIACTSYDPYTDSGVTNGTTYYYVVAGAYTGDPNAGGSGSAASPEASADTPEPPTDLDHRDASEPDPDGGRHAAVHRHGEVLRQGVRRT